mmetsp:Transcript_75045/g.213431  ORF Transcript_75045/g.213431 Transcript_75045/m.213431 type:complete len:267 (+) Transcript_75045:645-1445(+)
MAQTVPRRPTSCGSTWQTARTASTIYITCMKRTRRWQKTFRSKRTNRCARWSMRRSVSSTAMAVGSWWLIPMSSSTMTQERSPLWRRLPTRITYFGTRCMCFLTRAKGAGTRPIGVRWYSSVSSISTTTFSSEGIPGWRDECSTTIRACATRTNMAPLCQSMGSNARTTDWATTGSLPCRHARRLRCAPVASRSQWRAPCTCTTRSSILHQTTMLRGPTPRARAARSPIGNTRITSEATEQILWAWLAPIWRRWTVSSWSSSRTTP